MLTFVDKYILKKLIYNLFKVFKKIPMGPT